ncbi:hypothetical protein IAR50_004182 [Cryptococcus sp. DSM 104548]
MFFTRTSPPLDQLKLSHILSGDTCPPISFADFAAFVMNKAFSTEILLFVLWFQDYRKRWDSLKDEQKVCVPLPSRSLGHRPHPFDYLASRADPVSAVKAARAHLEDVGQRPSAQEARGAPSIISTIESHEGNESIIVSNPASSSKLSAILPCRFPRRRKSFQNIPLPIPPSNQPLESPHPDLPPAGTVYLPVEEQGLFLHAQQGFETFLKKGATHELFISDELREFAKACLQHSTAPDLFQPIYDEVYFTLEQQCLPRFLLAAERNINRPKQLFWYFVGAIDFTIGLITFLLLTLLLPSHPFSLRAYRLISTIFIAFGAMQAYSAYRGFCSQVWKRSHRQVWPWEDGNRDDPKSGDEEIGLRSRDMPMGQMGLEDLRRDKNSFIWSGIHPLFDAGTLEGIETPSRSLQDSAGPSKLSLNLPTVSTLAIKHDTAGSSPNGQSDAEAPKPLGQDEARQISPFAFDEKTGLSLSLEGALGASLALPIPSTAPSERLPSPAERTKRDIRHILSSSLMSRRRPTQSQCQEPCQKSCKKQKQCRRESYQVSIFGAEKLVEDPRIKKVYSNIRRDILIVGGIVSVLWVVMCLAVPCAGLL